MAWFGRNFEEMRQNRHPLYYYLNQSQTVTHHYRGGGGGGRGGGVRAIWANCRFICGPSEVFQQILTERAAQREEILTQRSNQLSHFLNWRKIL